MLKHKLRPARRQARAQRGGPDMATGSTVDDAFQYLTRKIGWQGDRAIYELTEALLAGRINITADGNRIPADFWRDHLALHVVEGRAEVRAIRALDRDKYQYRLPAKEVQRLVESNSATKSWRRPPGPKPKYDWKGFTAAELIRMVHFDGVPENDARISRQLCQSCVEKFGWQPDDSEMRKHVAQLLNAVRNSP